MAASGDVRGGGGGRFRIVGSSLWVVVESMMVAMGAADPMAIIFSDGRGSDRFLLRTGARVSRIFFLEFLFFSAKIFWSGVFTCLPQKIMAALGCSPENFFSVWL